MEGASFRSLLLVFLLLNVFTLTTSLSNEADGILVLGSKGLIGTALVKWLEQNGHRVVEVENRKHIDLRQPNALDQFDTQNIGFVYFLACEVGGSKFIASEQSNVQQAIIESNLLIFQTVFPWLEKHNLPFVYTSSYQQYQASSYGTIKRLGEAWVHALNQGRAVRLWNIYGLEQKVGLKSHVITDWAYACVESGQVEAFTDGMEMRQFLHVDDCAAALGRYMDIYEKVPSVTDLSSGEWNSLQDLATVLNQVYSCEVSFPNRKAAMSDILDPRDSYLYQVWNPQISLEQGIQSIVQQVLSQANLEDKHHHVILTSPEEQVHEDL